MFVGSIFEIHFPVQLFSPRKELIIIILLQEDLCQGQTVDSIDYGEMCVLSIKAKESLQ